MWIPLIQQGKLVGLLVVGNKLADEFLTRGDRDILDTLAHHLASAIVRAQLLDQLHGQVREIQALSRRLLVWQDEIQQQVAHEIHTHAVSNIIGVRWILDEALHRFTPEKLSTRSCFSTIVYARPTRRGTRNRAAAA